nr:immunoglobulin heavy chain junction region [Macaca mulatta]
CARDVAGSGLDFC